MPRLFVSISFCIAAALIVAFYVRPEWTRLSTLEREIADLEEMSKEFDELIANRDSLLERVNLITKENLDRLNRILPQRAQTSEFLVALEALALDSSTALRRIDLTTPAEAKPQAQGITQGLPQPRPVSGAPAAAQPKESEKSKDLPFTIQIVGSYASMKQLLVRLEKNLRLIDVENISFNAPGKTQTEPLDFLIRAKTYYH